jgi:hypothetical protein
MLSLFSSFGFPFFYVVASVVTAPDPVALVDASFLPTLLLFVAADVRPPFLPPFLPAAAFLDLVFAGFFDFPLTISLLSFRAYTTLLDHMMECT